MRFVPALLALCFTLVSAHATPAVAARTAELRALLAAALGPPPADSVPYPTLGPALADYAGRAPGDPARFEAFPATARRLLASGPAPAAQPPDRAAIQLRHSADALLASLPAGPAPSPSTDPATLDARFTALLARVHAHRILAAVHYCLFLRGQRLAELVAATYREKDGVAAYRELVALAAVTRHPATAALQAELKQYELNFKDLEDQCCPPSEAILREKVWQPAKS